MHKVYENNDLMMCFKKRHCHCCGSVLERKRTERIVRKGDPDHEEYCNIGVSYKPHGDILVVGKEYFCPSCNKCFSCEEQGLVVDAQKFYQRHIVTKEEIDNVHCQELVKESDRILKQRWFLLIPIIGSFICNALIFSTYLNEKTKKEDLSKLTLFSVLLSIIIALTTKLIVECANIDVVENYQKIIMAIPSALAFNLPTLCYINHKFKRK